MYTAWKIYREMATKSGQSEQQLKLEMVTIGHENGENIIGKHNDLLNVNSSTHTTTQHLISCDAIQRSTLLNDNMCAQPLSHQLDPTKENSIEMEWNEIVKVTLAIIIVAVAIIIVSIERNNVY